MKNLFREISTKEKNRILEMHRRANNNLISESNRSLFLFEDDRPEPVIVDYYTEVIPFSEGSASIKSKSKENIINYLSTYISQSIPTIVKFLGKKPDLPLPYVDATNNFPKLFQISVGTSATGSGQTNLKLGQQRLDVLIGIIREALKRAHYDVKGRPQYLSPELQGMLLPDTTYRPTSMNRNAFDGDKSTPLDWERNGYIRVAFLETMGLESYEVDRIENQMRSGAGAYLLGFGPFDPKKIVDAIRELELYSDIQDLDNKLGGLEGFLNREIANKNDSHYWLPKAAEALNEKGRINGYNNIARVVGNEIIINLTN